MNQLVAMALMLDPLGQALVKESTVAVLHRGCLSSGVHLPSLRRTWPLLYSEQASLTGSSQHICNMLPGFVVGFAAAGCSSHCIPVLAWPE